MAAIGAAIVSFALVINVFSISLIIYSYDTGLLDVLSAIQIFCEIASNGLMFVMMASLLLFFLRLARGIRPLGRRQVLRVALAGLMLVLRVLIVSIEVPYSKITVADGPIPIGISYDGGLDLKIFVFVALVLCMATVMRYGRVLEDELRDIA